MAHKVLLHLQDKKNNFATNRFVVEKSTPELIEIVTKYKPEVIWSDGEWEAPDWYWNSTKFLSWLYNESPVADSVVVNDRWGKGTFCKHGGFWNCQGEILSFLLLNLHALLFPPLIPVILWRFLFIFYFLPFSALSIFVSYAPCTDRYNPGKLMPHKWENAFTLDKGSWGFNRNATESDYMTSDELLREVVTTVAYGGNCLINIGPTADGRFDGVSLHNIIDCYTNFTQ